MGGCSGHALSMTQYFLGQSEPVGLGGILMWHPRHDQSSPGTKRACDHGKITKTYHFETL